MEKIPGTVWIAIASFLPLLITYLQGQPFEGQAWVAGAVLVLTCLLNLVKVYALQSQPAARSFGKPSRGKLSIFLLGG